jgi:hypothetical protein
MPGKRGRDEPQRHRGHGEKPEGKEKKWENRRDAEAQRRKRGEKLEIRNSKLEGNLKLESMKRSRARSKRFPVVQSRCVSRRG